MSSLPHAHAAHKLPSIPLEYAGQRTALLTDTSAMSCASWSIPAAATCPGMHAVSPDCICSACYAQIGRYLQDPVSRSQWIRFSWVQNQLQSADGLRRAAETLVSGIRRCGCRFFRIHDSGDFFSARYVQLWATVARRLPDVSFWGPTRSYWLPGRSTALRDIDYVLRVQLATLPNVVVRPSALLWDQPAPRLLGYAAGSAAVRSADAASCRICPKSLVDGGSCESVGCRTCWDKSAGPVAYLAHGIAGRHTPTLLTPTIRRIRSRQRTQFELPVIS